jgi:3',5'-cyclic AMP phosphodiesterase CpdA
MRLVHLSDPHVISWRGVPWTSFLNKRISGAFNFALRRRGLHRVEVFEALVQDIVRVGPDHVVVTGDVSSLAFASEMRAFASVLDRNGLDPETVSFVPGNHDAYTRRSWVERTALTELARYASSDLHCGAPRFPFVRIRGPLAILGLSSAVARPWFVCSGLVGRAQLEAFGELLRAPAVRERFPVVLVHHPPIEYPRRLKEATSGLMDREQLLGTLAEGLDGRDALVLSGHWHRRVRARLDLPGRVELLIASSASHFGGPVDRLAAYHLIHFEAGDTGLVGPARVEARGYRPELGRVVELSPPGA